MFNAARTWLANRLLPNAPAARGTISSPGGFTVTADDNARVALQSGAVYACARLISQSIASLPGHIFEETPEGKVKAKAHPYYRMLTRQPNAHMSAMQWLQTTVLHLELWGNAFTLPGRVDGEIVELYPIEPSRMKILLNPADGTYFFRYYDLRGRMHEFRYEDVIHFRIFSLDGVVGLSPIDLHRLSFGFETVAQGYAAALYANGGRPTGVLEYPKQLRAEQINAIRESWASIHSGADGVGKVAVLDDGTKYTPISVPLQQMEYVASQKYSVEQIARIFGVPPHLIGAQDKTPYASVEQQSLEFSEYTLQPIVTGIEQTLENALLEAPYIYRLNLTAFARADVASRYRAYATGRQWGWFSVNDIRELEDLNRIGEQGDVYLQPLNMVPADAAADEPAADAAQQQGVPQ